MGITIDKVKALRILEAEANATQSELPERWAKPIRDLSRACEGASKSHIAFLGIALLAKATDLRADVYAVKKKAGTPGAYSTRSLGHGVLVEHAPRLGIDIALTGREPMNNQPYFQIKRATEDVLLERVKGNAKPAVRILVDILRELDSVKDEGEARLALRTFIAVRREFAQEVPELPFDRVTVTFKKLAAIIPQFVGESSEGGRRAQAVVAGLLDVLAGPERVLTDRINDPDRNLAGDVGIRYPQGESVERVFEVRDKPVHESDLYHFAQKAADAHVPTAVMLALNGQQEEVDLSAAAEWAKKRGVNLAQYVGWERFVREVLFWASVPMDEAADKAFTCVRQRLIGVEASVDAIRYWDELIS